MVRAGTGVKAFGIVNGTALNSWHAAHRPRAASMIWSARSYWTTSRSRYRPGICKPGNPCSGVVADFLEDVCPTHGSIESPSVTLAFGL